MTDISREAAEWVLANCPAEEIARFTRKLAAQVDELEKVKDGYALLMGDMPSRVDLQDRVNELEEVIASAIHGLDQIEPDFQIEDDPIDIFRGPRTAPE